jgi:hypothetical protein
MNASTPIDDPSLKLPRPFVRALVAAGLTSLGAAWAWSDDELLALHGAGPKGVRMLRELQV